MTVILRKIENFSNHSLRQSLHDAVFLLLHLAHLELGRLDLLLGVEHGERVLRLRDVLLDPLHGVLLLLGALLGALADRAHRDLALEERIVLVLGLFVLCNIRSQN